MTPKRSYIKLPNRCYLAEESEKGEIRFFRAFVLLFLIGLTSIVFYPGAFLIGWVVGIPLGLLIWGLVLPIRSSYEIRHEKELENNRLYFEEMGWF